MSAYTTTYPPSYWDPVIIKYIGLVPEKTYYKNYILKCLTNKLKMDKKYGYNKYEFDDKFIEILKIKLKTNYIWRYSSKYGISKILNYFKSNIKVPSSEIYMIDLNDNGNNIEVLSI